MDAIITHQNVDLDAVFSLAAAREFVPGARDAKILFVPANWNEEADGEVLMLDIDAGGRGIKGKQDTDGTVHSCFKALVEEYASPEDQKVLAPIVRFIDIQDSLGNVVSNAIPFADAEVRDMFGYTGLNAVLRALQTFHRKDDHIVCQRMEEIFIGRLYAGRSRLKAETEANEVPLLYDGRVAVVTDARRAAVTGLVFARGARIVIYNNGNDIGILRHNEESSLRVDHEVFRRVVEEAGEAGEWFAHPAGYLYCSGSRKSPRATASKVNPYMLAEAAAKLLDSEQMMRQERSQASASSIRESASRL